jgi:hypothetical protein
VLTDRTAQTECCSDRQLHIDPPFLAVFRLKFAKRPHLSSSFSHCPFKDILRPSPEGNCDPPILTGSHSQPDDSTGLSARFPSFRLHLLQCRPMRCNRSLPPPPPFPVAVHCDVYSDRAANANDYRPFHRPHCPGQHSPIAPLTMLHTPDSRCNVLVSHRRLVSLVVGTTQSRWPAHSLPLNHHLPRCTTHPCRHSH